MNPPESSRFHLPPEVLPYLGASHGPPETSPQGSIPRIPGPIPQVRQVDSFSRLAVEKRLSWDYPNPLASTSTVPDHLDGYTKTSLNDVSPLLSSGQVTRFESPQIMQPWAGPPGTPNRIFTFQMTDGRKLFTIAQYNQETNQLIPPSA